MTSPRTTNQAPGAPRPSAAEIRRLVAGELALPSRLGYTLLLLASLAMTVVIGALLATEPALPLRTRVAMWVMVGIGLAWAALATWVLSRRRVLLAEHRVVAGRMAVAFTTLFVLGALATSWWGGTGRTGYAAASVGLVMLGAATALWLQARRRHAALSSRRAEIERQMGRAGAAS